MDTNFNKNNTADEINAEGAESAVSRVENENNTTTTTIHNVFPQPDLFPLLFMERFKETRMKWRNCSRVFFVAICCCAHCRPFGYRVFIHFLPLLSY